MSETVTVAIPAYNAGPGLLDLAGQLSAQDVDDIYILDDASTDGSVEAVGRAYPRIQVVRAMVNRGPSASRNRILEHVHDGLLLFIDADMSLESNGLKRVVRRVMADPATGLTGGYIMNKQRNPMGWNYGFEMDPRQDTWFSLVTAAIGHDDIGPTYRDELLDQLRAKDRDYNWVSPNDFPLTARAVDWVAEGLFAVRTEVFRRLGGYDENMSYHEGQDLARRIRDSGLTVRFDPSLSARHREVDSRSASRHGDFRESQFYFFRKHWGMSRDVFEELYP